MLKISVITVCYNSAETIRDTLESVMEQTYQNIEYIIVDGASKDQTMNIVKEYQDKIATVISEPDKGIYDAMNKGIAAATGDVIGILNSDDIYASNDIIQKLVKYIERHSDTDAFYADLVFVERNATNNIVRRYSSKSFAKWKVRFGFMCPHPTFYAKKELFGTLGSYKLDYRVSADFELMARFFKAGIKSRRLPEVMVKMREGGISTTGFWWRIHQNMEIVRACRENGIYTNILMVAMKVPFKLASYLKR